MSEKDKNMTNQVDTSKQDAKKLKEQQALAAKQQKEEEAKKAQAAKEAAKKAQAEKAAAEKAAQAEKAAAEKKAKEEKAAADKKAKEEKAAADKKAKEEKAMAAKKAKEDKKQASSTKADKKGETPAASAQPAEQPAEKPVAEQKEAAKADKKEKAEKADKKEKEEKPAKKAALTDEEKDAKKAQEKERKAAKKRNKKEPKGIVNVDAEGNVIGTSYPVSKRDKKDHRKTSVGYTAFAVLLYLIAILAPIGVTVFLAVKSYMLLPYYSFWHFVGLIIVGVVEIVFTIVTLIVSRKKSKSSILVQTAKIAFTYACLTTVFGLIFTYIAPDIIANATSSTLYAEDLYYNASEQVEENAALERTFLMYNVLNGNLNKYDAETGALAEHGDFSYQALEEHTSTTQGSVMTYKVPEINDSYVRYKADTVKKFDERLATLQEKDPYKYELYQFVYNTYTLNDFDYALDYAKVNRRAVTLAIVDYIYMYADYEQLVADGFKNKKLKALFDANYDNFNQDGYQSFDDALLLYAQLDQRMTIPVVLRLILNKGWAYTQPTFNEDGSKIYYIDDADNKTHNFMYEIYDPQTVKAFVDGGGKFELEGNLLNADGVEYTEYYGFNEDGWQVYENGIVRRPINWLVLDMLGDPMSIASIDLSDVRIMGGISISMILDIVSGVGGGLYDGVGELLHTDVAKLIQTATNGAGLNLGIYFDDNGALQIQIMPMNATYGMLGYMQSTWVQSNNLLMAVINALNIRDWLFIFGAVGTILVIAAGVLRECGKRTRERAALVRDRLIRAGVQPAGDMEATNRELAALGKAENDARRIEKIQEQQLKAEKEADEARLQLLDIQMGKEEKLAKAEAKARKEEAKKEEELAKQKASAEKDALKAKEKADKAAKEGKADKKEEKADKKAKEEKPKKEKEEKPKKEKPAKEEKPKKEKPSKEDKKGDKAAKPENGEEGQAAEGDAPAKTGDDKKGKTDVAKKRPPEKPAKTGAPSAKKPPQGNAKKPTQGARPTNGRPANGRPTNGRPSQK